jgi:hypothetical protein
MPIIFYFVKINLNLSEPSVTEVHITPKASSQSSEPSDKDIVQTGAETATVSEPGPDTDTNIKAEVKPDPVQQAKPEVNKVATKEQLPKAKPDVIFVILNDIIVLRLYLCHKIEFDKETQQNEVY